MSWVTAIILSFDITEGEEEDHKDVLALVNSFFDPGSYDSPGFIVPEGTWCGGSKHIQRPTYVGSFNYINIGKFLNHLRQLTWKAPENLQVMICDEDDDEYRVVYPCRWEEELKEA